MKPAGFLRTWSEEEDAVLAAAVAAGRPIEEVAAELGRSVNAVQLRKQRTMPRPRPDAGVNYGWSPGLGRIEKYWTPERVQDALRDFVRRHKGPLPTSDHEYSQLKKGHLEWPTAVSVLDLFGTMADAWAAVGAPKSRYNRGWVEWTQADDDYLLEHAGEQTLKVIGKALGRSWSACKRRLYDLGAGRARDVSGYLSAMQVAKEYRCPVGRVQALIERGELRAHKVHGGHYWRIDPSDLAAVEAKLKKPRRSHKRAELDLGDYRRRKGLARKVGADGRVRDVAVTPKGQLVQQAKKDRKRFEAAMRVAVQLMEDEGLVVDLGVAS